MRSVAASPVGAGVEQAGHRPNGGVELGDQQQHRESGPQPQAAGDQAHTRGDGHQRGREHGGQVQDHAGEERQAQRALVVRRYRSVTSRIPASWALPRLKARRLGRAATVMPITFQPTLMPRSALDQALVTGISTGLNYSFAALVQDSIEALALRGAGRSDPSKVDRHRWRRASIGLDLAAIGAGLALQRALRPRPDERLPREGAGRPPGAVGHRPVGRRHRHAPGAHEAPTPRTTRSRWRHSPAPPWPRSTTTDAGAGRPSSLGWGPTRAPQRRRPKSFAVSLGVTAGLTGLAAGERLFASGVGRLLERGLPGHERLYRPLGHLAAMSVLGSGLYGPSPRPSGSP
jgi:hypothetical protein